MNEGERRKGDQKRRNVTRDILFGVVGIACVLIGVALLLAVLPRFIPNFPDWKQGTLTEWLLVLLTASYVLVTAYQLRALRDQLTETQRSIDNQELVQAARLVIDNFEPTITMTGKQFRIQGAVKVTNVGETVASEIYVKLAYGVSAAPPTYPGLEDESPSPDRRGPHLAASQTLELRQFDWGTERDVLGGAYFMSVAVWVSYRTIFGRAEIVPACFVYNVRMKRFISC